MVLMISLKVENHKVLLRTLRIQGVQYQIPIKKYEIIANHSLVRSFATNYINESSINDDQISQILKWEE